jgi:hypothetical protein
MGPGIRDVFRSERGGLGSPSVQQSASAASAWQIRWGGIGRTSTVVGCLLVDRGLDADAALADIDRRRSVTRKAHQAAPQTPAQIDVVHARAARRVDPAAG